MLIIRPSIIGASLEEPFPGWTDSITLAGGIYLIGGMGILRELPGDENKIGDQIPVDLVSNQILLHIPLTVHQARQQKAGAEPHLVVTHCSTSETNPIVWRETLEHLTRAYKKSPFEQRVFNPSLQLFANKTLYKASYVLKRKLPMLAAYHVTRALPLPAKTKADLQELKDAVDKCEEIGSSFQYFTENEWIFQNRRAVALNHSPLLTERDRALLNCDVTRVNWALYLPNFTYGIKRFILKEEAELPSVGYSDVIARMANFSGENFLPFSSLGKPIKVRSSEEMKRLILGGDEVKEVIAQVVNQRTSKYKQHYQLMPNEDQIYRDVHKEAVKILDRIMSTYDHG